MTKTARISWLQQCTVKERRVYYGEVASQGCLICCDTTHVNIHHCTGNGFPSKREHRPVIPLCTNLSTGFGHHQGNGSIHAGKQTFQDKYGTQDDLLFLTEENLHG